MRGRCCKRGKGARPSGTWLAFLALTIQVLLPFLVAYEIGLAGTPANAETITICHAPAATTAPGHGTGGAAHHGLADGCPICLALAAGQAFTATAPVTPPLPQGKAVPLRVEAPAPHPCALAAASYNPRAPPFIA